LKKTQSKPTIEDWLYAGLLRFAEGGERNLTIERIAEDLAVSKGSYYYYFSNRENYIRKIFEYSIKITTEDFIEDALKQKNFKNQLQALILNVFKSRKGKDFDFYLRDFAKNQSYAKKIIQSMDERRISFIAELLIHSGLKKELAFHRATIFYHYYLGWHSRFKNTKINEKELFIQLKISEEVLGVNFAKSPTYSKTKRN
jgi:AcrR family transcriptional regulator